MRLRCSRMKLQSLRTGRSCIVSGEKDFKIILKSPGGVRKELTSFGTEEEAESFCKENGWEWVDENGFMWGMDYEEVDLL